MNLNAVINNLGSALKTIPGLNVFDYLADRVVAPGAMVCFPETLTFDIVKIRNADRYSIPIALFVGRLDARNARARLGEYFDNSSTKCIKNAVERYAPPIDAWQTVRVTNSTFGILSSNGVEYLGAQIYCDVVG